MAKNCNTSPFYLQGQSPTIQNQVAIIERFLKKQLPNYAVITVSLNGVDVPKDEFGNVDLAIETIKGDKGDKGDPGEKGDKGDKGDSGAPGTNGNDGADGKDGKDGKDGIDGIDGSDGADGKSAYEIWLEQGHTGTEEDFLNWLREGEYLKQIQNLDNYEGEIGEIVQYKGETNSKYTNGYIYKKVGTQTIIPAGTKYIRITDSSGELAKVGIPNGDYYKIEDDADPVAGNIMWYYCHLSDNGAIPIRTTVVDNVEGKVIDIGCYGYADYKFRKVYNVTKVDSRGHVKIENPYDNNSVVQFEDGYNATVIGQYVGVESLFPREDIEIYESVYGIRIYKSKSYPAYLLPLEYYNGIYRVIAGWTNTYPHVGSFSNKTSTGTIVLNDEWQQWDVQPRDDTKQYWNEY